MTKRATRHHQRSWLRSPKGWEQIRDGLKKRNSRKFPIAQPAIYHERNDEKHVDSESITFSEKRGIRRENNVFLFSDVDETLALYSGSMEADTHASLFEIANSWLLEANEKDFFEIAQEADAATKVARTNKAKGNIDRVTFQRWWFEIGMKHGFLSPAAIASNFLTASDLVHRLTKGNKQLEIAIYQFADAWHWLHFEVTGEHKLATIGLKSSEGRARGPVVKQQRAELRAKVVAKQYTAFASDPNNAVASKSAKRAAEKILSRVNSILARIRIDAVSEQILTAELRPLVKKRFPKPARKMAS